MLNELNLLAKVIIYSELIDLWLKDKLTEDLTGVLEILGEDITKQLNQ